MQKGKVDIDDEKGVQSSLAAKKTNARMNLD